MRRQPGFAFGEFFDGPPTAIPPRVAKGFGDPSFVSNQPTDQWLPGLPSFFHVSGVATLTSRDRRLITGPEIDSCKVATEHATHSIRRCGPGSDRTMKLDATAFPWHLIATRAGETGRGSTHQPEANQQISIRMPHILPPKNHLLRETARSVIEGDRSWIGRRIHGPTLNYRKSFATVNLQG
jgi:hypothetical protein